jgi:hypothetical protein
MEEVSGPSPLPNDTTCCTSSAVRSCCSWRIPAGTGQVKRLPSDKIRSVCQRQTSCSSDIYFTIKLNNLKLIKCSLFRMAALGAAEDRGLLRTSRETAACPQWGGRPRPRASPWTRSPIMPLTERGAQLPVPLNDRPDNPAIDA